MRRVTIRDVAREAGVSVTTVSVVLNNSDRPVRAQLREKVLEAARSLDYHPSEVARGLVRQRTDTIGVLFGEVEEGVVGNYYAAGVLAGVVARAQQAALDLHLFTFNWEVRERPAQQVLARQPDGVLVLAPSRRSTMASELKALGMPVVAISTPADPSIPFVDIDNVAGTRLAVEHLIGLGHRRIAHVVAGETQQSVIVRRETFLATMQAAGLAVPDSWLVGNTFNLDGVHDAVKALLSQPERPSALFCTNDGHALQALRAAQERGIRVPEQLSIVGFDDFPAAAQFTPALTTIRQPFVHIGTAAVELLLDAMAGRDGGRRLLSPELVIRASTAPPPG